MINRNKISLIYENEKNFNLLIKLYKSVRLSLLIRIRKLPVFCLVYFMNIQAGNINNHSEEANIKDVLIKIQEEDGIEKEGNGIIFNLDYGAVFHEDDKQTRFTINNLEYNGIGIINKDFNDSY
ncbi:hypothetical protein SLOPH_988, partial [Spraguea lophii 42_110]